MRFNYDDNYFSHKYQGMPADGYGFYLQWLAVAGAVSVVLLAVGLWTFRRLQADFAEEL